MKRIKKITLLLLLGGFVAMLSLVSAGDASAQRRARRNGPTHTRIIRELPQGYGTLVTRGDVDLYFQDGLVYRADPESDTYTIVNPQRRTRTGRGAARYSTAGRRGGSQFDRFRYRNSRRSFTPGTMRRGSRY